ncbi:MAG: 2,3-bisphosphoglycerate-independent phosphoglycerate mutase [Bacteroidota bacterium]
MQDTDATGSSETPKVDRAILVILDGWGLGTKPEVDAIQQAHTPYFDQLMKNYPNSTLITFGEAVGLPEGQMGNSEVGHLNIGAGRVVYQEFARINRAIREQTLHKNKVLLDALAYAKKQGKAVHLMGLVSDGGVHSHINHLKALCDITQAQKLNQVYIHAFMDGRDTAPKGGMGYLKEVLQHIDNQSIKLASVIGRYYAMDRDKRWERVKLAYDLLVKGAGEKSADVIALLEKRYSEDQTDEFLKPIVCTDENDQPIARIKEGDVLICFNFRTDRPREISEVLTQKNFPDFDMKKLNIRYVTMTRYDENFKNVEVLFSKNDLTNTLGEVLSKARKTQIRIAETEKYPHVTFFFNGGREKEFEGESRIIVPSPKVDTYDLQPEMSAEEVTERLTEKIKIERPDFVCINYANTDMVGHTGDFEAAMKAATTVDTCLKELMEVCLQNDYGAIIIADHGNSDYMMNEDGTPHTAHTTNLVPCIYVAQSIENIVLKNGKLGDIAPSILSLLDMEIPVEMDGEVLLSGKS